MRISHLPLLLRRALIVTVATSLGSIAITSCTSDTVAGGRPTVESSANTSGCAPDGQRAIDAFFRDFDDGRANVARAYFAQSTAFERWWDPTMKSGVLITSRRDLAEHLRRLRSRGTHLRVTEFRSSGGGWFIFHLSGNLVDDVTSRDVLGKGRVDCASGRLAVVVYGTRSLRAS
jgi:hypothetical protein